jgi:hypothetical protein
MHRLAPGLDLGSALNLFGRLTTAESFVNLTIGSAETLYGRSASGPTLAFASPPADRPAI